MRLLLGWLTTKACAVRWCRLTEVVGAALDKPVRLRVLDEHRCGLLLVIRRVWSRRGVRVHALYATTYKWGYLHEALEIDGAHDSQLLIVDC